MIAGPATDKKRPPIALFGGDVPTVFYSDPDLGGDGRVRLNPDKANVKWQWISAALNGVSPFAVGVGATLKANLTVRTAGGDQEGDFEAFSLLTRAVSAGGAHVRVAIQPQVNTPTINRFLSNQPISATLLSGTSQLPGVFLQAIYCLPKTSWKFDVQTLGATAAAGVTIALQGRRFQNCSPCNTERLRRRAQHLQWFHPYWIGPQDPSQPLYTGPEVTLAAGATATLTFPIPSDADFLMFGALDDSSSSGGGEPSLYAQITLNDSQRGLVDLPAASAAGANASQLGISWRDFLAIPTITGATGFQLNKVNAYSLAPQSGRVTHLVPRNTQVVIKFISTETVNVITLRPALFGLLVYGRQPAGRQTSIDGIANRERITQGEEFLRRMGLTSAFGQGKAR